MSDKFPCKTECMTSNSICSNNGCKYWIDYDKDLNCSLVAAEVNGPMTLDEVSQRMGLSLVRIKQIERQALEKIKKRSRDMLNDLLHE